MTSSEPNSERVVELYVRSLYSPSAHQRQESVIESLQRLEADGTIDEFSVVVWGKHLTPDSDAIQTEKGERLAERINEFEQWARDQNVSLTSFYQTRETESLITDTVQTALSLPMMGLAEYVDGDVVQVTPYTDTGSVVRVEDHVDELAGTVPRGESRERRGERTESMRGDADD